MKKARFSNFSWFFAKNCPKMAIFFIFGGQFFFIHTLTICDLLFNSCGPVHQVWNAQICSKVWKMLVFLIFLDFLPKIAKKLSFWGLFLPIFYFWTFMPINIMVKTSFERSMCHKCVLGCTYVLQRLVSIDFLQFADKMWQISHFLSFFGSFFFWNFNSRPLP